MGSALQADNTQNNNVLDDIDQSVKMLDRRTTLVARDNENEITSHIEGPLETGKRL